MIEIDGSHGEGGGQLLRMAVACAALQEEAVRVVRIRAGRPNPGLSAQHVTAVRAVSALCGAKVEGLEVGSSEISFEPSGIVPGRFAFDVGTAGSVSLVLQACLPVAFAARGNVGLKLVGGTDVRWSPPVDYVSRVFLPLLRRLGGDANLLLLKRGYYPRGGGGIEVTTRPASSWSSIDWTERGNVRSIRGIAHVSNLPEEIPKRMKHASLRRLHGHGDAKIEDRVYTGDEAVGQGGALVLWAETGRTLIGATCLAERGKSSERVGEEAATALVAELDSGATLDIHAADQLLPYLVRAPGPSQFTVREITDHLSTMAWLLPQFFPCEIVVERRGDLWYVWVTPCQA